MFFRDLTVSDAERLARQADALEGVTPTENVAFEMDEDTFRAFYDRTSRMVWAYLARLTGDRNAADDLLQETYYRFLRARANYESEAHRRNSLFRIATNLARDGHRRRQVIPLSVPHDDTHMTSADRTTAPGRTEQRQDLTRALVKLKPRERALVWLAYVQGSSHKEIADVLGVRAGSVKPLLFRARKKLAALLDPGRLKPAPPADGELR